MQLKSSQIQVAIDVLGHAFKEDPVFHLYGHQEEQRRLRATKWFSRLMFLNSIGI
jgi:hypothetical protein